MVRYTRNRPKAAEGDLSARVGDEAGLLNEGLAEVTGRGGAMSSMELDDIARYRHRALSLGLPEDRADEAIRVCIRLLKPFVDAAHHDGPVEHALNSAKNRTGTQAEHAILPTDMIGTMSAALPEPKGDKE